MTRKQHFFLASILLGFLLSVFPFQQEPNAQKSVPVLKKLLTQISKLQHVSMQNNMQLKAQQERLKSQQGQLGVHQKSISEQRKELQQLKKKVKAQKESLKKILLRKNGGTFTCSPKDWDSLTQYKRIIVCSTTITLQRKAVVLATFTGHWNTKSSCYAFISFDKKPMKTKITYQIAPAHSYSRGWESMSSTLTKVLPKGTHKISYVLAPAKHYCALNGTSLHGMYYYIENKL